MKIVILGAGGLAREVLQLVKDIGKFNSRIEVCPNFVHPLSDNYVLHEKLEPIGFIDENQANHGKIIHKVPVLGGFEWLKNADSNTCLTMGVGFPRVRKKFFDIIQNLGLKFNFPVLVHPTAHIGENVKFGEGSQVMMNNSITVDITVGEHVHINQGCSIGHDVVIGNFVYLSPHCVISGYTYIGEGADIGSNASTRPLSKIGAWSVLGLNAGVVKDIPERVIAVGCPAKPIKELLQ
ncbi:MAG TPA: acetyltransferase [Candidatus Paceibacterota bacterium]